MKDGFVTKDSGKRQEYATGMVRDVTDGKTRFDLVWFPLVEAWQDHRRGLRAHGMDFGEVDRELVLEEFLRWWETPDILIGARVAAFLGAREGQEELLRRWAELMTRGAVKYGALNWQKAATQTELDRFRESAARHFFQWYLGDRDEDHAAAVLFNLSGAMYVADRMGGKVSSGAQDLEG